MGVTGVAGPNYVDLALPPPLLYDDRVYICRRRNRLIGSTTNERETKYLIVFH